MPFRDIAQRRLASLLAKSVARDALPPSLIFAGPEGSHVRQAAVAVAQAINCLSPVVKDGERDACGSCAVCARIVRGVHPDVLVVEPDPEKGRVNIEQIRDVIDRAGFRPFEARRRVVVIDQADTMQGAAQSALLKTLEEPPSASMLILVTSRPDMLLATVRSRCPLLRFVSDRREEIDPDAREIAGEVLRDASAGDATGKLEAAKLLLPRSGAGKVERDHVARHLHAMASLLRDVEVLATRADAGVLANADIRPELDRLTKTFGGDRGIRAYAAVDQALSALDDNHNAKIVADWLVLQL
jgi:DNA polymerase-3 subunit delta'